MKRRVYTNVTNSLKKLKPTSVMKLSVVSSTGCPRSVQRGFDRIDTTRITSIYRKFFSNIYTHHHTSKQSGDYLETTNQHPNTTSRTSKNSLETEHLSITRQNSQQNHSTKRISKQNSIHSNKPTPVVIPLERFKRSEVGPSGALSILYSVTSNLPKAETEKQGASKKERPARAREREGGSERRQRLLA